MGLRNKLEKLTTGLNEKEIWFHNELKTEPLEKNDLPAMILAAFLVFLPVMAVVAGIFVLLCVLFS